MLPQIKKKIKAFLMDETGSISKANLVKGALFLSAAGATIAKVKAACPATVTGGGSLNSCTVGGASPGTTTWTCEEISGTAYCKCTASSNTCSDHTNTGIITHWSADDAVHRNNLRFDRDSTELEGEHGHHGFHGDSDSCCGPSAGCVCQDHANHCNHGSHTSW